MEKKKENFKRILKKIIKNYIKVSNFNIGKERKRKRKETKNKNKTKQETKKITPKEFWKKKEKG